MDWSRDQGWTLGREIAPDMLDARRPVQRWPRERDWGRATRSLRFHVRREAPRGANVRATRPNFTNRMAIKASTSTKGLLSFLPSNMAAPFSFSSPIGSPLVDKLTVLAPVSQSRFDYY